MLAGASASWLSPRSSSSRPPYQPADDEPGPDDLARITEALKRADYQSFEGVEFDDGVWQVDDAVGGDGREYDLELDPQTLEIIRREAD